MSRLYIICEGQSEQRFVEGALAKYLNANGLNRTVKAPIIKSSKKDDQSIKGGNVTFDRVSSYINIFLKQENDCIVTTLIDFYALSKDFPGFNEMDKFNGIYAKVTSIENAFYTKINNSRVIPYIQLHEFETFYFADTDNFISTDPDIKPLLESFKMINQKFVNPEEINNSPNTAPSKRIEQFFNSINLKYKKTIYAELYAQNSNIEVLREKCQNFNKWIEKLLIL